MGTDLRKAAEMALEALEEAASCVQNSYLPESMGHDWDRQIEALRQAIEQAEPRMRIAGNGTLTTKPYPDGYESEREFREALNPPVKTYAGGKPNYCTPVDAVNMTPDRVDETAKGEHEPVAWMYDWYDETEDIDGVPIGGIVSDWISKDYDEAHSPTMGCHNIRPLYTAPPKREWVGLTDEEIYDYADKFLYQHGSNYGIRSFGKAVEAKLKEKNG